MNPSPLDHTGYFERFGVTPEILRRLLSDALSRGAEDCDLFFEHRLSQSVRLMEGKVNAASSSVDLGVGIRARVGDQVGYAYTESLDLEAMRSAARTAAEIAAAASPRSVQALRSVRVSSRYPMQRPWSEASMDDRMPLIRAWEARAFERDDRIEKVQVFLADSDRHIMVVRPDGRVLEDHLPMAMAFVSCTARVGDRRETNSSNVAGRAGLEFFSDAARCDRLVHKAVDRTLFLLDAERPPAGEMTVVLGPGPSGVLLHEAIGHGLEADFNRKGVSIYASRLGKKIAPDFVSIVDDGTRPGDRGAINFDDEGNPAECTTLIEEGVLKGYLHDEISAASYGVDPTGSGRRQSFRHCPMPRMRSTYMLSGPHDPQEIVRSVKKGIYCTSFSNGQVQIGAGDFAFYVKEGWLIEDGKLTRPIKDANLIGNGPEALERVEMVGTDLEVDEGGWTCGKDGQRVPVSQGQPTMKISSLIVGGVGA